MNKSLEKILIVDFGYNYTIALAEIVRDAGIYCEIVPSSKCMEAIKEDRPQGLIFVGANGEVSVNAHDAQLVDKKIFECGIPILAFGYGMNVIAHVLGGKVKSRAKSKTLGSYAFIPYGEIIKMSDEDYGSLFGEDAIGSGLMGVIDIEDYVSELPEGFRTLCTTLCGESIAGMKNESRNIYAFCFEPIKLALWQMQSILHTVFFKPLNLKKNWTAERVMPVLKEQVKSQVQDKKVLLALSGGVDSTVLAHFLASVIGEQLTCVFVNTGLMRKNESEEVKERFENKSFKFVYIDAAERFLSALKGVCDPEEKRRVIGETYIRVFEESAKEIGNVDFLAQGTIYADVVESGAGKDGKLVKSHHNVGGLPEVMDFKGIVEPFKNLLKGEVRKIGEKLNLPLCVLARQPFPGPGLAVRIIGEITKEKVRILQEADEIWRHTIERYAEDLREVNQYFAVLTDMKSVGVKDGRRTYGYVLALRAITTKDFMTADSFFFPLHIYNIAIEKITERVPEVTRIVYDLSSKPPATIEWE